MRDVNDYDMKVTDITINGNTATAKAVVESRRGKQKDAKTTFALAREDGKWRLTDFGSSWQITSLG